MFPLGNADATDHPWHARPASGKPPENVGVEQERLQQVRLLVNEQFCQPMQNPRRASDPMSAKKMDLDVGRFQGVLTGSMIFARRAAKDIDDRLESLPINACGKLNQAAFGAADFQLRDAERHPDRRRARIPAAASHAWFLSS